MRQLEMENKCQQTFYGLRNIDPEQSRKQYFPKI